MVCHCIVASSGGGKNHELCTVAAQASRSKGCLLIAFYERKSKEKIRVPVLRTNVSELNLGVKISNEGYVVYKGTDAIVQSQSLGDHLNASALTHESD